MHKHWQEIFILILLLIFAALISSILLGVFINASVDGNNLSPKAYLVNAVITQFIIFGGTTLLYFKITGYRFIDYIGLRKLGQRDLISILISFLIAITITIAYSPVFEFLQVNFSDNSWVISQLETIAKQNNVLASLRGIKLPIAVLIFALLPAIFEELVFRGILYRIFKDLSGKKTWSMVLSAFIFAVVHFQILSFLPIFVVGILLAYLYERTKNLVTSMALHFLFNAIQVIFWEA